MNNSSLRGVWRSLEAGSVGDVVAYLSGVQGWEAWGCGQERRKALSPTSLGKAAVSITGSVQQQEMLPDEQHVPTGGWTAAQPGVASPVCAGQARCWLQHAHQGHSASSQDEAKNFFSTFSFPTALPLAFSRSCCLSTSLKSLLLSNVWFPSQGRILPGDSYPFWCH